MSGFQRAIYFRELFDEIVNQCVSQGLLTGKHLTVDSTYVRANAALKSLEPIVVSMGSRRIHREIREREPGRQRSLGSLGTTILHRGQKISNGTHRSKTDPDARLARKSLKANTHLYHGVTYVMDNRSRIIVGADVGKPDRKTDCEKALKQIRRIAFRFGIKPESLGADKGYSHGRVYRCTGQREGTASHSNHGFSESKRSRDLLDRDNLALIRVRTDFSVLRVRR